MIKKLKKLLPLLALAVGLWLLKQLSLPLEAFSSCCGQTNDAIKPKYPDHSPNWTHNADGLSTHGLPSGANGWCDQTPSGCERNAGSCTPCSGGPEGLCRDNGCGVGGGWHNSITRDCSGDWAPHNPDGTRNIYKKPNYYGWGSCQAFSYGEPYYSRSVKY